MSLATIAMDYYAPELLPADWPGPDCIALFCRIREAHSEAAAEFVRHALAAAGA